MKQLDISLVIPTLGRDLVLVETIESLLALKHQPAELLVIDQTLDHDPATSRRLSDWDANQYICWIRLSQPSITRSMNLGLRRAACRLVLFLDDDVRPRGELFLRHAQAHSDYPQLWATVGQVIQPWQQPAPVDAPRRNQGLRLDEDFPFYSTRDMEVQNVMAGNLCVNRKRALSIGGFDENFQGTAFRFETEFARRIAKAGGTIRFLGGAGIDHLRVAAGGTRVNGSHLTSASPKHGVGDHYYAMRHARSNAEAQIYCLRRMLREVRTKYHLTHPWWIPVKLIGEVRAYFAARRLVKISTDANSQLQNPT